MSLLEKIEKVLAQAEEEVKNRKDPIRRAEELSDQFSDVKPKTDMPSLEQFMGLPTYSEEKSLFRLDK